MSRLAILVAIGVIGVIGGCVQSGSIECANGVVCPGETTCDVEHGLCLVDGQTAACDGLADADPCEYGTQLGICDRGVCVPSVCGNGVLDSNEVCDDGNRVSGDMCRADCLKIELCGDAVVDQGEGCDDGNTNASDGCDACVATGWITSVVIGGAPNATTIGLSQPARTAVDRHGNVFILDSSGYRVRRVDPGGVVTTVAGNGTSGAPLGNYDGVRATSVALAGLTALAVDDLGNVYIAAFARIDRIDPNGIISRIAGTTPGFGGDGGLAVNAQLGTVGGVAVDGLGNIYVADSGNNRIRRIDAQTKVIQTIAGTGAASSTGDGGAATAATLNVPNGIALAAGALYVAEISGYRVRRIDAAGTIETVAGNGTNAGALGDGGDARSAQVQPYDVSLDSAGNLYIAEATQDRVRKVDVSHVISTFAGTGVRGFSGDNGPASLAQLGYVLGVTSTADGTVYISEARNNRIRRVDTAGVIATFAGIGSKGYFGEGGSALSVAFNYPDGVATDATNRLIIADTHNARVRRVDATGIITTLAGTGDVGFAGDGGPATAAMFDEISDVKVDATGIIYVADTFNNRIRKIDTAGVVTTIAGGGSTLGDGGPATSAQLDSPYRIALAAGGVLYIADTYHHRVRRVASDGTISTAAGTGVAGFSGDGGQGSAAQLSYPYGIAVDAAGNLFIADSQNSRVRRVDAAGVITTVAGSTSGFSGDGGPAASAQLDTPTGLAFGPTGDLYVADQSNYRVRRIASNGVITTVAGNGQNKFVGDGGPATSAQMQTPSNVAVDSTGILYITDSYDHVIRRVDTSGTITTAAGKIDIDDLGPLASSRLIDTRAMVVTPAMSLFAGGGGNVVLAQRTATMRLEVVAGTYPQIAETANLARFRDELFGSVDGIAYDSVGHVIYVTQASTHSILAITVVDEANENTWTIAQLAGGTEGFADGALAGARFRSPSGLYWDAANKLLYVADTGNSVIRTIDLAGGVGPAMVRTIAGTPQTRGFAGDGWVADEALLYEPRAITRCPNGDLFIADTRNHRIRRVTGANRISTVLGDGTAASSGEGAPATIFPVNGPEGLACDATNNLFVTSTTTVRLLPATNEVVDGSGAVQTIYGASPRDMFPASVTSCLTAIATLDAKTVQVADACAGLLVQLTLQPQ